MNEVGETRVNKKKVIGRDEGIFVKTMFGFKESRSNVPHKLKAHMRSTTSTKLTSHLSIY